MGVAVERAKLAIATVLAIGIAMGARDARAQPTTNDSAASQAIFDQGRRLMGQADYAGACAKFEESQRLDPASGTALNLGTCYEHLGKFATAWSKFLEAASLAKAAHQADRERFARAQAAFLEARISTLVINVANDIPGLEVRRNGEIVGKPQWGNPIPIDPGEHRIVASAPYRDRWETTVLVGPTKQASIVHVPALTSASVVTIPGALSPPAPLATSDFTSDRGAVPSSGNAQRIGAYIAGGIGVAGLAVGTYFGLQSKAKGDEADEHCNGGQCRDLIGVDLRADARVFGNVSTVAFIVGAVGVAGGAVLWFSAPKPETARVGVSVGAGSMSLRGSW
ncbi:MAG: hypothetical protein ABW133_26245 [Polyangiaceae bacterium]